MSTTLYLTYRFRIKGASSVRRLNFLARNVNLVWNFINATSFKAIKDYSQWISEGDLQKLTKGCSKELGLNAQTIQALCQEYVTRRIQFKKRKLGWRVSKGSKKSLGWIPFKALSIKLLEDLNQIKYAGQTFNLWHSWKGLKPKQRNLEGTIQSGNFSQDAQGNWYLNLTCKVGQLAHIHEYEEVGVDLGLKDSATLSDGYKIENPRIYRKIEEKLAKAQRANKKKQVRKLHQKVKNQRKEYFHKRTSEVAKKYQHIYVGNVSGKFLQQTNGKSSSDASIGTIRSLLNYKALRHSGSYLEVVENSSTIICSNCFERTGPSGLNGLEVREWSCKICHTWHDRDVNSANNHLRDGRVSLRAAS